MQDQALALAFKGDLGLQVAHIRAAVDLGTAKGIDRAHLDHFLAVTRDLHRACLGEQCVAGDHVVNDRREQRIVISADQPRTFVHLSKV
ncbi:hypothetical protein D3C84_943100 [compost metagenome]